MRAVFLIARNEDPRERERERDTDVCAHSEYAHVLRARVVSIVCTANNIYGKLILALEKLLGTVNILADRSPRPKWIDVFFHFFFSARDTTKTTAYVYSYTCIITYISEKGRNDRAGETFAERIAAVRAYLDLSLSLNKCCAISFLAHKGG